MISLQEAAEAGITRVTSPLWGGNAYLRLTINASKVARVTAYDYADSKTQINMNAWAPEGQNFPFDAEGLLEPKWLPFGGKPSPYEV